jgi:hypothetical protein
MFVPHPKSSTTSLSPSRDTLSTCTTPGTAPTSSSTGRVISSSTSLGAASG